MVEETQEKELRIVLDAAATVALETMVQRMKDAVSAIKVQPSHFVSFLVADFLEAHFERDMAVLIAEFFDSDAYHEAERKLAKGNADYEELMQAALDRARKIKGKKRRKAVLKKRQASMETEVLTA
jgi:hypothetical protein